MADRPAGSERTRPVRILQVNTLYDRGGAAEVCRNLHRSYLERGLVSWVAVKRGAGSEPWLANIPNRERGRVRARLGRWWDRRRGSEDFRYPGTRRLLDLFAARPDLVHGHNLHGGYFDLRALPWLSAEVPVVLTLHDAWLLSGHCAHSMGCPRWETGCGSCPDLTIYPSIPRDGTARNWRRKRAIFADSRFWLSTPSRWLMHRARKSMLWPAVAGARVIPNGIDLSIFRPADRTAARRELGIPDGAALVLFVSDGIRRSYWRDWELLRTAAARAAESLPESRVLVLGLGEEGPEERLGATTVRCVGYESNPTRVATYFQAADLYVHPARADTFPSAVLQALACGTPVIATDVGGIPEQVRPLGRAPGGARGSETSTEATGILVPPNDRPALADALQHLLSHEALRAQLAANAARDAHLRFGLQRQIDETIDWYEEILGRDVRGDLVPPEPGPASAIDPSTASPNVG